MVTAFIAFWTAHGALIETLAVVLLPSVITAASKRPSTSGLVPMLQVLLDRLSVLTHKDSPGTLKAPIFQGSKEPS